MSLCWKTLKGFLENHFASTVWNFQHFTEHVQSYRVCRSVVSMEAIEGNNGIKLQSSSLESKGVIYKLIKGAQNPRWLRHLAGIWRRHTVCQDGISPYCSFSVRHLWKLCEKKNKSKGDLWPGFVTRLYQPLLTPVLLFTCLKRFVSIVLSCCFFNSLTAAGAFRRPGAIFHTLILNTFKIFTFVARHFDLAVIFN